MHRLVCPVFILATVVVLVGCGTARVPTEGMDLVDPDATSETRALYANLQRLAPDYLLFGHEDDLGYGVHWWAEDGRSDVQEVTGSCPAVYGWDIGDLENGADSNLDSVRFDNMQRWIKEGYERGGVITISWHMDNPLTGGDSWDTTRVVPAILPGGEKHELYLTWLDRFADFVDELEVGAFRWLGFGERIPIIFRPYHEHTGFWFWWGRDSTTPEEYVQLWRFTVDYLRDEKGLNNLLYAYSPNTPIDTPEGYLEHYPGDDYVDIFGYDDYGAIRSDDQGQPRNENGIEILSQRLRMIVELAEARGKIAALAETGDEGLRDPTWFTQQLLPAINGDPVARRLSYALVWRNANAVVREGRGEHTYHYYAPYPGHPAAPDFVRFYEEEFVLFESELPDLYR